MTLFDGIILGIIQGITEFLPVSSTGHLIIAREFLGLQTEFSLTFDAILHLATAGAVFLYYRKAIFGLLGSAFSLLRRKPVENRQTRLLTALAIGTVPAVIFGLFFEDSIETIFRSTTVVAGALVFGSALMWLAERYSKNSQPAQRTADLTPKKGILIGLFQALALIPGISRSGATISGGLLTGLSRSDATQFAFLLSFPVILGAGILSLFEFSSQQETLSYFPLIAGALSAFISGYGAIHFLVRFLSRYTLSVFIIYRIALALFLLWIF